MTPATILRAEWTRFWALRSTRWSLAAFVGTTLGLGLLVAGIAGAQSDPSADPVGNAVVGLILGSVAMAVMGCLVISSEYGSGSIRATFAAMPKRSLVLTLKASVVAVVGLVVGWLTGLVVLLASMPFFSGGDGPQISLGDGATLRVLLGCGLFSAASALFGFGLGALTRSSAGGVVAAVGGLLVAPFIIALIPHGENVAKFFPLIAGVQVLSTTHDTDVLGPWAGFGVLCVWWLLVLAGAYALLERRDA